MNILMRQRATCGVFFDISATSCMSLSQQRRKSNVFKMPPIALITCLFVIAYVSLSHGALWDCVFSRLTII